jgi:copper chaperone CopZ
MEYYIHQVPGRIRIQTPLFQNNPEKVKQFEDFIRNIKGITSVATNPVTGSALLLYDERVLNCEQVIGILETHGYFKLSMAITSDGYLEKTTEKILKITGDIIAGSLGGLEE